jgi:shikimate kinase
MKGTATTHGAASIVNGIACGRGAAFGLALRTEATVELTGEPGRFDVRIENEPGEETALARHCVSLVLERLGLEKEHGAIVTTRSQIPISRGLKSSSAAANAIVLSAFKALGAHATDMDVIDIGIKASFCAGVTITGAFDDACATYFGNVVVTDNIENRILAQYPIDEDYDVVIHVPIQKIRKREVDVSRLRSIRAPAALAARLTMEKDYKNGMLVNGLAYSAAMGLSTDVALRALEAGAATAGVSGTGPATVVLVPPDRTEAVVAAISGCGDKGSGIIRTRINAEKAR